MTREQLLELLVLIVAGGWLGGMAFFALALVWSYWREGR